MAVYNLTGSQIYAIYNTSANSLSLAYDINGTEIFSDEEPFVKTILKYSTNWLIDANWLANAESVRDSIIALYTQSEDAIPFFIQTDGHGRFSEGNVGCHNLAEPIMRYIANIQLGDYESYYYDGKNPADHATSSDGLKNYLPVMGNHEFLTNDSPDSELADLPTLIESYTPSNGILGSQTYGFYKVLDDRHHVKYLIGQPHIPDANNSSGFITKFTNEQWEWFIDELELNDGYDVIVLNHEPFGGTYYRWANDDYTTRTGGSYNLTPILSARKAKTSGAYTDNDGVVHSYDFINCTSDLLCVLHGHEHQVMTIDKTQLGYPVYVGRDFTNAADCVYGLIDRANGYLHLMRFTKNEILPEIVLDL